MNVRDQDRGDLLSENNNNYILVERDGDKEYWLKTPELGQVIDKEIKHEGNTGTDYQIDLAMDFLFIKTPENQELIKLFERADAPKIKTLPINSKGAILIRKSLQHINAILTGKLADPENEGVSEKKPA